MGAKVWQKEAGVSMELNGNGIPMSNSTKKGKGIKGSDKTKIKVNRNSHDSNGSDKAQFKSASFLEMVNACTNTILYLSTILELQRKFRKQT